MTKSTDRLIARAGSSAYLSACDVPTKKPRRKLLYDDDQCIFRRQSNCLISVRFAKPLWCLLPRRADLKVQISSHPSDRTNEKLFSELLKILIFDAKCKFSAFALTKKPLFFSQWTEFLLRVCELQSEKGATTAIHFFTAKCCHIFFPLPKKLFCKCACGECTRRCCFRRLPRLQCQTSSLSLTRCVSTHSILNQRQQQQGNFISQLDWLGYVTSSSRSSGWQQSQSLKNLI